MPRCGRGKAEMDRKMVKQPGQARHFVMVILTAFGLSSCSSLPPLSQQELTALDVTNPQFVDGTVLTGGQPSETDLDLLKQSGFRRVISLRAEGEDTGYDEAAKVRALGMSYISIPVSTDKGLDAETAQYLRSVLAQSSEPTLLHCGSGNRVGAMYAIGAFHLDGDSLEQAIEKGRAAGLTGFEPRVREMLVQ